VCACVSVCVCTCVHVHVHVHVHVCVCVYVCEDYQVLLHLRPPKTAEVEILSSQLQRAAGVVLVCV
jgi:hypothetical protein